MEDLIASNGSRFLFAVTIVGLALGALVGVLWLLKHRGAAPGLLRGARPREQRLAVIESTAVDARRRLVLVRRDDVEHLLLIGGPADLVLESRPAGVLAAAPAVSDRSVREPAPVPAAAQSESAAMAALRPTAPAGRDDGRDPPPASAETGDRAGDPSGDRQGARQNPVQAAAVHPGVLQPAAAPSPYGGLDTAAAAPSSRPPMPTAADRPRAAPVTDPLDVLFPRDAQDDEASAAAALARRFDQFADDEDEVSSPQVPAPTSAAAQPIGFAEPSAGRPDPAIDPLDALFPPETAAPATGVTAGMQATTSPRTQAPEEDASAETRQALSREHVAMGPAPAARTVPVQAGRPSASPVSDPLDMLFPEDAATGRADETAEAMRDADASQIEFPPAPDDVEIARSAPIAPEPEAPLFADAPSAATPVVPPPSQPAAVSPAIRQRPITRKGAEPTAWDLGGAAEERDSAQAPSDTSSPFLRPAPMTPAMAEPDGSPALSARETRMRAAADPPSRGAAASSPRMPTEPRPAPQAVRSPLPVAEPPAVTSAAIKPRPPEPAVAEPLATRPAAPDETPAVPGTAAAEFAQKLANERRMPFEQRLARAAAQRAAETTRPAAPPVSAMGQVLYRDGEADAPSPTAPGRLPPRPEPPARPAAIPPSPAAADTAKAATADGGDQRSAADLLDAARERVLATSRPQPPRAEAQPAGEQPARARTPAAQPGSFESILAAGADDTAAPVTAGRVAAARSADRRSADARITAAQSTTVPSPDAQATESRSPSARPLPPRATAGQPMPRATPTAPPKPS